MSDGENARFIYLLVLLAFVASGLFARRLPLGQTLKYALAWVGIFAAGFVLFSFKGEAGRVWQRVSAELSPGSPETVGGEVRIRRGEDGHFHVKTEMNGHDVTLMIDSGATVTSLSEATARAAELEIDDSGFPVMLDTANGMAEAKRANIGRLVVGSIKRSDSPAYVSPTMGEINVLGMNFLNTLKSWRVEGDMMVLTP